MRKKEIKESHGTLERNLSERTYRAKYIGDNVPGGQMKLATENKIKC